MVIHAKASDVKQVASSVDQFERVESENWLLHRLFLQEDYAGCQKHMQKMGSEKSDLGVRIRGFMHRYEGNVAKSIQLFQESIQNSSRDTETVKHIGKSLYLVGRHIQASRVYENLCELRPDDADVWYSYGMCLIQAKQYNKAIDALKMSNAKEQSPRTYMEIAKAYTGMGQLPQARESYKTALSLCPEDPEILTGLGLVHFECEEIFAAFEKFGSALVFNPRYTKAILGAGAIIQADQDTDAALTKYRIAIRQHPENYQLWNNVGMCFESKGKTIAALSCLKRAYDLNPLAWKVCYNLGIIYLRRGQHASSFHYLSCAVNLEPKNARLYMYVAMVLFYLEDVDNASTAYRKALKVDSEDYLIHLNYTIMLLKTGQSEKARESFQKAAALYELAPQSEENPLEWVPGKGLCSSTEGGSIQPLFEKISIILGSV